MVLTGQTTRAAESGHWYARNGEPMYEVPTADGKRMRAATLADARKHGWYPGCTSIIKCAAAPGLELWKQKQVLLAARTIPHVEGESDEDMISRILADAGEQARKAREGGTEAHAALQGHYEGKPPSEAMWPIVQGVVKELGTHFGERHWIPELPVAHPLGFGTKSDLHCRAELPIVLDFKGTDFDEAERVKLKTWDEHAMQLAATREALRMPEARCGIVYYSRNNPGLARFIDVDESDLDRGWAMFRSLLGYWKASKNYYPELWQAKEAA
jgi:hypothetical protein